MEETDAPRQTIAFVHYTETLVTRNMARSSALSALIGCAKAEVVL